MAIKKISGNGPNKGKPLSLVQATEQAITECCEQFQEANESLARVLVAVNGKVSQTVLRCGVGIVALANNAEDARKAFNGAMKAHKEKGGEFEPGKVAITISVSSIPRPKWKEAAVESARKLATLEGKDFDEEAYVEQIQAEASASESTTVKLTQSD